MSWYTAVTAWYCRDIYGMTYHISPPSCSSFASFRHRQRFVAKTGHHSATALVRCVWNSFFAPRNSKFHATFRRGNFQLLISKRRDRSAFSQRQGREEFWGRDETFARGFDRQTFVEVTYPEADAMTACVKGQQDLVDLIDWNSVEVLNQNAQRTYVNAVKKVRRSFARCLTKAASP